MATASVMVLMVAAGVLSGAAYSMLGRAIWPDAVSAAHGARQRLADGVTGGACLTAAAVALALLGMVTR
jgi:hypothetical protein